MITDSEGRFAITGREGYRIRILLDAPGYRYVGPSKDTFEFGIGKPSPTDAAHPAAFIMDQKAAGRSAK
jgi:hypothetical protein